MPTNPETVAAFGAIRYRDRIRGKQGAHAYALASVLYDVLNRIAIDTQLLPGKEHEIAAALTQVAAISPAATDLLVADRGYHSYRMLASLSQQGVPFVLRCKRNSGMRIVDDLLDGNGGSDRIAVVSIPAHLTKREEYRSLPATVQVRFVRIRLKTGEYEVLATSVLDDHMLTPDDLREVYRLRWCIETFYGVLKTRLQLENFSGQSPEAIRQDFFAAIFLTGAETILTEGAQAHLAQQRGGRPKQVNKAVSFNALKYRAFDLFMSDMPLETILAELTQLFATSPTIVRPGRNPQRQQRTSHRLLCFWKRQRKMVF